MSTREVPIVIITGYLGSGKTTLMQNILKQEKRKIALIVNDMGSINIDASILNKTGNQVAQVEMVEMQNGCICCTLRDEFMAEIERLSADMSIEAVFVEASGISEPSSIAGALLNSLKNIRKYSSEPRGISGFQMTGSMCSCLNRQDETLP